MAWKFLMKLLLSLFCLLVSTYSFSSDECTDCTIRTLGFGPHYDGSCVSTSCVYIQMKDAITNRPLNCIAGGWHFTLDTTTDSGKGTLSALLSAYAMGKKIGIKGSGYCSNSSNTEDLQYVFFSTN